MNKKVLTLCAGMLLAGSFATVDAKIALVSTPEIGASYVLGAGANVKAGSMTSWVQEDLSTVTGDVTKFGSEWTLEQYGDVEGQFILKNPEGKYLVSTEGSGTSGLGTKQNAIVFKFNTKHQAVVVSDPQRRWNANWYLAISGNTMNAAASIASSTGNSAVQFVTFSVADNFNNNALIKAIGGDYYFVGTNTAAGDGDKVLEYDAATKSVKLSDYPDSKGLEFMDIYDHYLWKVSESVANNIVTYTFESRVDGAKFTFTSENRYNGGFNLTGNDTFTGTEIVALYQSPLIYKTAGELNDILTNGFEMTIKKNKDDNSVVDGVSTFSGKLIATPDEEITTRFQITNEDGEYLVLNTKANWGTGNVGVNDRGHKFEWVAKDKVNSGDYCSYFEFNYYAGAADEKVVESVAVYSASTGGTAYGQLFIQSGTDNSNWLTTSNGKDNKESWPYIILQSDNIVKINEVNERFLTFAYADTKVNAGNNKEVYKFGGMLVAKGLNNQADYVDATTLYEKAPEAQWGVTGYNSANNTFTLSNRESQEEITGVQLRWEDKAKGICTVYSDNDNFNKDLVKMTVVTDPTMFDGFAKYNDTELRNNKFYLGQYHGVAGNNTGYFVENHGNSHQIGVTAEEGAAGKWNLRFATCEMDKKTVVDTVFVTTEFYTLKSDGSQETDDKKINKMKLAILPYAFQNAENREYVEFAGDYESAQAKLDYYFCNEKNLETPSTASRFALKMKANGTYNFVEIAGTEENDELSASKVWVANSEDGGSLKQMGIYTAENNSLMVVDPIESPEYHQITTHAWGDTIRLFRGDNASQVLYEKKDAKSVVANDTLSFLNVDNTNQFDINPSMFADTAYINRTDADGIKNTCYQYLLAVQPKFGYHVDNCNNPAHKPDVTNQIDTVYGRFLVNLIDTANIYAINNIHNNPYIIESEAGDHLAKLSFVNGFHTNDTLYIARENADTVKLAMDTPDFNVAKFAFRYVDDQAKTFKIQTQYKEYAPEELKYYSTPEDVEKWYEENPDKISNEGYLRWVNGTIAIVKGWENGDVFSIEEGVKSAPTANEEIATSSVIVAGVDGAVVVKGAEGKNVIVSTILGKVVANETVSSDNATIAAPQGVVVVSVDGESFKVVVK